MKKSGLVFVDARGRVSLGKFTDETTFLMTVEAGGRIILEPATVIPKSETPTEARP